MTAAEILAGGGIVLAAMTLIQIAPIKLDPWSAIARAVGRAINKDVIDKLDETREILDTHIKMDGARTADAHRARILQFNNRMNTCVGHSTIDVDHSFLYAVFYDLSFGIDVHHTG